MTDEPAAAPRGTAGRLADALAVYARPRIIGIAALGYASGLPLVLTGSTLALYLADRGLSLQAIGLFSLVGLPYTLKPLWAPVLDTVRLPVFARLLGRRRGWLALTQILLVAAIAAMGALDPASGPLPIALAALVVAVLSATQDVAVDAFRVEAFEVEAQPAAMAAFVAAYRVALVAGGAGTVFLVTRLEGGEAAGTGAWAVAYALTGITMLVGLLATLAMREPSPPSQAGAAAVRGSRSLRAILVDALVAPFRTFMGKRDWVVLLLFVALFKLGDALAGALLGPFALDLGFDKATIAAVSQGVGLASALAGGFVGGLIGPSVSLATGLWIAGIAQMVSNLSFTALALVGPVTEVLVAAVAIEAFTGGVGTVLFVAFLSGLCTDRAHTATQYALLSALASLGRTLFSASAGFVAAAAGWPLFFALTAVAALPGLLFLWWLDRNGTLPATGRDAPPADRV